MTVFHLFLYWLLGNIWYFYMLDTSLADIQCYNIHSKIWTFFLITAADTYGPYVSAALIFFWLSLTLCKVIFSVWKCVCLQEFTFWLVLLLNSEIFVQIGQKINKYKLITATDTCMRCVFVEVNTHNFYIQY